VKVGLSDAVDGIVIMADKKPEKKDDHAAGGEKKDEGKKGGGFLTKLPVLLGGVMAVEAVVLVLGLKMLGFGQPKEVVAAQLAEHDEAESHAEDAHAEDGGDHGDAKADEGGHGDEAKADEGHGDEKGKDGAAPAKKYDKKKSYEVQLVEFRAPNKMSGRTFLYDISIFVLAKGENVKKVQDALKDREALIKAIRKSSAAEPNRASKRFAGKSSISLMKSSASG
jgi:hypothetical protein